MRCLVLFALVSKLYSRISYKEDTDGLPDRLLDTWGRPCPLYWTGFLRCFSEARMVSLASCNKSREVVLQDSWAILRLLNRRRRHYPKNG